MLFFEATSTKLKEIDHVVRNEIIKEKREARICQLLKVQRAVINLENELKNVAVGDDYKSIEASGGI